MHSPDLGCALQNTEGLGKGLGLVCRSQGCPVTTATNSRAEVMPRKRSKKRKGGQTGIQQTQVTRVHVHTTHRHTPTHSAGTCKGHKILTHDVSVAVRAKVIKVAGNHWNQIIWGKRQRQKIATHAVPVSSILVENYNGTETEMMENRLDSFLKKVKM